MKGVQQPGCEPAGTAQTLPAEVSTFVGRRGDVAEVRRLLRAHRLVTFTGPGGVGKTRLAVRIAAEARRAFAGGVRFVDLSAATGRDDVLAAVAHALGALDQRSPPSLAALVDRLAGHDVLLGMDNCEHISAACAEVVDRLLHGTAGVRVLATSRHTLGIDAEHLFVVPPLPVPELHRTLSAAAVGEVDAVRLLTDRADAVRPGFEVTDGNAEAVARLCVALDGLPLAIELAAVRLRSLSVEQVLERLDDRFALLTTGRRTALPRRRTLRGVVDWSHSLCSDDQRLLWARASVFAGSFDLAAAEAVCADAELPADRILDVLGELVAQSVVTAEHGPAGVRFRLLETMRQYARDLLDDAAAAALARRHRHHYLAVAEAFSRSWFGAGQAADLARLRADHDNLHAAFGAAARAAEFPGTMGRHAAQQALRLAAALWSRWCTGDLLVEGRAWLDRALALPGGTGPARTQALQVAIWVCLLQGDPAAAAQRLDECERSGAGADASGVVPVAGRGSLAFFTGDLGSAIEAFETVAERLTAVDDLGVRLWIQVQYASALVHRGERAQARAVCEQALSLCDAHGEKVCRSYVMWVLGVLAWRGGDAGRAERHLLEALSTQRLLDDCAGSALLIETLAWISAAAGDLDRARSRLAAAQTAWSLAGTTVAAFGPAFAELHDACLAQLDVAGTPVSASVSVLESVSVSTPSGQVPLREIIDTVLAGGPAAAPGTAAPPVPADVPAEAPAEVSGAAPRLGHGLTTREETVAGLIGEGLSNRAIATVLGISVRTVEGHVERILAKLAVTSRSQVAIRVAAREAAGRRSGVPAMVLEDRGAYDRVR